MITCYVVDDESHSIEVLSDYISDTPGLSLVGACEDPLRALDEITSVPPNITFLDVDMPKLSGIEFCGLVNEVTSVVFTTAFAGYAVQAFEKNADDYLLKPITYERFLQCISKVKKILSNKRQSSGEDYFYVKTEIKGKAVRIRYEEIVYISAEQNYMQIHLENGGKHLTYITMKEMEEYLPSETFTRVHKSFIVNNHKIEFVDTQHVIMKDQSIIMMGSTYKEDILKKVNQKIIRSKRFSG